MVSARADVAIETLPETATTEELALAMAKKVARRAIFEWEGVGDENGSIIPVSPKGIDALLEIWPVSEAFQTGYVAKGLILDAEKNVIAPLPGGPSAGASGIAPPVKRAARPAPQD